MTNKKQELQLSIKKKNIIKALIILFKAFLTIKFNVVQIWHI